MSAVFLSPLPRPEVIPDYFLRIGGKSVQTPL